ncbi:hypothetical protein B4109_1648 [Geobacillus stearothermophilus]|uniref:Uncharacterized protein n=1 Tax=Geobacillus stearothermophilus TaxID=1422 RepID=A0A150MPK4_GEOSE|nr:hypothetical protein B4109_1648 [Geobacillus stearothermophilus]
MPADSRAADPRANTFIQGLLNDEVLTKVEQLEKIAAELGITLSQLALAWVLRQPPGTSRRERQSGRCRAQRRCAREN